MPSSEHLHAVGAAAKAASTGNQIPRLLYRPAEAAQAMGMSRTKIYELMQSDRLAYIKIDGARRIPAEALEAFVDGELRRQGFLSALGASLPSGTHSREGR